MKRINIILSLLLLTCAFLILFYLARVFCFQKDIRSIASDQDHVFTVSETYLNLGKVNGKFIRVEGHLSSVGGELFLVDISGDKRLQIPDRMFELEKGSYSNILILKGKYEVSGDIMVDNFLTNLKFIEPAPKSIEK